MENICKTEDNSKQNNKNIERRVKKYIKSKEQTFFVIFPPYFQNFIVDKFKKYEKESIIKISEIVNGGIEFITKLEYFYKILFENLGVVRYLLRIKKFSCKNFQKLYSQIRKIEWDLYLPEKSDVEVSVSAKKSKLYHSEAISERVKEAIVKNRLDITLKNVIDLSCNSVSDNNSFEDIEEAFVGNRNQDDKNKISIFVRLVNDIATVSLDLVGDPLYIRGWKRKFVRAPIRENIANLIIQNIDIEKYELFCDPMCGSGTFIYEILFNLKFCFPFQRKFSIEFCPFFSRKTFEFHKKKWFEKNQNDEEIDVLVTSSKKITLIAGDINIDAVKSNFESFPVSDNYNIKIFEKDFFDYKIEDFENKKSLLIFNPPYNERIKIREKEFFSKINKKIIEFFNNKIDVVVVLPEEKVKWITINPSKKIKFKNGNISVYALYFIN